MFGTLNRVFSKKKSSDLGLFAYVAIPEDLERKIEESRRFREFLDGLERGQRLRVHKAVAPRRRKIEPIYIPTFFDRLDLWPKCQRCRKKYAPVAPKRKGSGILVPRCYCSNCGSRLNPMAIRHIEVAEANAPLAVFALELHRKDIYRHYQDNPEFRVYFHQWSIAALAQCSRCFDPNRKVDGKPVQFSTYATKSLKNLLNREWPFIAVFGQGEEPDNIETRGLCDNYDAIDDEIDRTWHDRRKPAAANPTETVTQPQTPTKKQKLAIVGCRGEDFASYGVEGGCL